MRSCDIEDCERRGRRLGLCDMHYMRKRRHGDTDYEGPGRGVRGSNWKGDEVGYTAAHRRVIALHGSASKHMCAHCLGQASDWAYDHLDPDEKTEARGTYSPDPSHYLPLCRWCHRAFDAEVA